MIKSKHTNLSTIWYNQSNQNYSTPKVREDTLQILKGIGTRVYYVDVDQKKGMNHQMNLITRSLVKENRQLILQFPLKPLISIPKNKNDFFPDYLTELFSSVNSTITLVHDIKSIQCQIFDKNIKKDYIKSWYNLERIIFDKSDLLIVHSYPMKKVINSKFGIPTEKMITLGIFDYLGKKPEYTKSNKNTKRRIAFAGYLGQGKKSLINSLCYDFPASDNLILNLYGPDFIYKNNNINKNIKYRGSVSPTKIIERCYFENDFGLIWDDLNTKQRSYYNIISPHKASLYIASCLPIIAPSNTYIGDFVEDAKIGYTIDNLAEISEIPYESIDKETLLKLQNKVIRGKFFMESLNKSISKLRQNDSKK
jgi:hypothetical protein